MKNNNKDEHEKQILDEKMQFLKIFELFKPMSEK